MKICPLSKLPWGTLTSDSSEVSYEENYIESLKVQLVRKKKYITILVGLISDSKHSQILSSLGVGGGVVKGQYKYVRGDFVSARSSYSRLIKTLKKLQIEVKFKHNLHS